ncbi:MAG: biotin/lipoyl-binding protein [Syntrophaceae bacterium]|nr:biotin/lipoyl-binding protein [Syntrophaceae bacterium]
MKKFRIRVNGRTYEVEVEEIIGSSEAPAPAAAPAAAPKPAAPAAAGDEVIAAPMPGKVLSIAVQTGQSVKAGDLILVLEAMKMENEIVCGRDGVVKQIGVSVNATVNTGDPLAVIG